MSAPLALILTALASAPTLPRLVVLDLQPGAGVDAATSAPLGEAVTAEVQRRGFFEVVSTRDVQALLGLERQRQLLGCGEAASASCMAELSGALGARFVLSGSIAKLGETWQLTLSALDSQRAQPVGRATRLAHSLDTLRTTLPWAVAEATATPAPPAPSKLLPGALVGTGAAAAVFGLVWGAVALGQQQQLEARLQAGTSTTGVLGTRADAALESQRLVSQQWVAAGALGLGVVLAATGAALWPADVGSTGVALVPAGPGVAVAGVWP